MRFDRNICVCQYFFVILQRVCLRLKIVKRIIILLLVILSLYCVDTVAYTRLNPDVHHFVSFDAGLGYSSLLNDSNVVAQGNGASAYLGVGYRLLYNNFLFSMGLEAQYLYNAYSMDSAKMVLQMLDTEADAFKLNVDATQGDDWVHAVNLSVPVLLGMEYRRFYFLVGPKFSFNMWNQMQAQAQMVTTATYDQYIDDFANMPNHELGNYVLESERAHANWTVDIIAHAEIGYRFGDVSFETGADIPKPKQRFYVALFVDYGLLNLNRDSASGYRLGYRQLPDQPLEIYLTPALMSREMSGVRVNQLSAGVKVAVLLELPKHSSCVICNL